MVQQGGVASERFSLVAGATPQDGVPDMTVISEIDEYGINTNLKVRYQSDRIYVSSDGSVR